jgi:hypothetical protein
MAKVDRGTIKRDAKSTPLAKEIKKTETFTAVFASDAHAAADLFFGDANVEILGREEVDAGDAGTTLVVTYK